MGQAPSTPPTSALSPLSSLGPGHSERAHWLDNRTPRFPDEQENQALESTNWAGLIDTGPRFTSISATWVVPAVQPSDTEAGSSTWIGIDGVEDPTIIQAGTAQNTIEGETGYTAWFELYPEPATPLYTVSPGDEIEASITEDASPADTWTISLADVTSGLTATIPVSYDGPGTSAEWIEEDEIVGFGPATAGRLRHVTFDDTAITDSSSSPVVSTPVYLTDDLGNILAYPKSIGPDSLTIAFGSPPRSPTTTTVAVSPSDVAEGDVVTYDATVTSDGGTPTGFVVFDDGFVDLCEATLSDGFGSCTSTDADPGTDTVTGSYFGDPDFSPSSGTTSLTVDAPSLPPPVVTTPTSTPAPTPTAASTPQHGYWLVGSDGGIFTFGSAAVLRLDGSLLLQRPVVGISPTADRRRLLARWPPTVASSPSATPGYYGSHPRPRVCTRPVRGLPNTLNAPIVGMVPSSDGGGYFMVASDGGVFAFGDAKFAGSCPGIGGCSGAAVAVMPDASGNGYWLVTAPATSTPSVTPPYYGAPGPQSVPVTSAVRTPDGAGYWILFANGQVVRLRRRRRPRQSRPAHFGGFNPATAIFATSDGGGLLGRFGRRGRLHLRRRTERRLAWPAPTSTAPIIAGHRLVARPIRRGAAVRSGLPSSTMRETRVMGLPDGRELAWLELGDAGDPAVFVFHGSPGFRLQVSFDGGAVEAARVRSIAVDRPGYGHSSFQRDRRLADWASDISRLADHLHLDRFSVVGISGGGPHAAACARSFPIEYGRRASSAAWGPWRNRAPRTT